MKKEQLHKDVISIKSIAPSKTVPSLKCGIGGSPWDIFLYHASNFRVFRLIFNGFNGCGGFKDFNV